MNPISVSNSSALLNSRLTQSTTTIGLKAPPPTIRRDQSAADKPEARPTDVERSNLADHIEKVRLPSGTMFAGAVSYTQRSDSVSAQETEFHPELQLAAAPTPRPRILPRVEEPWRLYGSSAPGTNYFDGKRPTDIATLKDVLKASLSGDKARNGLFDQEVCFEMTGLLAHELSRKSIPYRVLHDRDSEMHYWKGLDQMGLFHSSLRVFTKDRDGKAKWMIVDPTIGQWFSGGTVGRDGSFVPKDKVLSGGAPGSEIFVGTYKELVDAFEKNISRLSDRGKLIAYFIGLQLKDSNRGEPASARDIALKFVELFYGKPNDVGHYPFKPDWSPEKPIIYKQLYDEVTEFKNKDR